jgi:hypothetical protein
MRRACTPDGMHEWARFGVSMDCQLGSGVTVDAGAGQAQSPIEVAQRGWSVCADDLPR